MHKSSILANWVQIEMGKTRKTINVDFFNVLNHKTLPLSYVISNSTLLKDLIFWLNQLHINHKSDVFQPIIIMYHTKVLSFFFAYCF